MTSNRRPIGRSMIEAFSMIFRARYAPATIGMLDPEPIIEFDMKMDIVPRAGMAAACSKLAMLACDGRTIFVDEAFQRDNPTEYRSLILHEASHRILHRDMLPTKPLLGPAEFARFHDSMSEALVHQIEWEARELALRIQVPTAEMQGVFDAALDRARDEFPSISNAAELFVEAAVARHFGVSHERAQYRISKARLWRNARRKEMQPTLPWLTLKQEGRPRGA